MHRYSAFYAAFTCTMEIPPTTWRYCMSNNTEIKSGYVCVPKPFLAILYIFHFFMYVRQGRDIFHSDTARPGGGEKSDLGWTSFMDAYELLYIGVHRWLLNNIIHSSVHEQHTCTMIAVNRVFRNSAPPVCTNICHICHT